MPREFTIKIVLSDNFLEEGRDVEEDLADWKKGSFTTDDLTCIAENEPECSVTYEVRDV